MTKFLTILISIFMFVQTVFGSSEIVINEIFYHAPNDLETLEFIEIHNRTDRTIDLSDFRFTKGLEFTFPKNSEISPNGYVVICRELEIFQQFFDATPIGVFEGSLSNSGEQIELSNAKGEKIDSVKYSDRDPWSISADGYSSSLERISPSADSDLPQNWSASPLPKKDRKPTASPGKQNFAFSENLPPIITNVKFSPKNPKPDQPIEISAKIDKLTNVKLLYRIATFGSESDEIEIPMTQIGDHFTAKIPNQISETLIRFRIRATDQNGTTRFFPNENEIRPAISIFVLGEIELSKIAFGKLINVSTEKYDTFKNLKWRSNRRGGGWTEEDRRRWMAMNMLENGMNVKKAWFELSIDKNLEPQKIPKLAPIFDQKLKERDLKIDQILENEDLMSEMKKFPQIIQNFNDQFLAEIKPNLSKNQHREFSQWLKRNAAMSRGRMFRRGPARIVERSINLENRWFAVTTVIELELEQIKKMISLFNNSIEDRNKLIDFAEENWEDDENRDLVFERIGEFEDELRDRFYGILTADQRDQFREWEKENQPFRFSRPGPKPPESARGGSAFIYIDTDGNYQVFDFISATERKGGYKIRFHKDRPLKKMTTINLIYEYDDWFVLAEPLAYEVYRRAGVPAELTEHLRVAIDEDWIGYHLLVEQPNRSFLRRNKRNDDGNLYKILWYERGVVDQHEKKTNPHNGHDDIIQIVDLLNKTDGEDQWRVIRENFNVDEVINYFAVNLCISNWDGFFNNYFTYHDLGKTGKWEIYPWDEDKTWGYFDGGFFVNMPLNFGSNGAIPPNRKTAPTRREWGRGDLAWWRDPGYFSGPILANPHFRERFLIRLKEIAETIYTENVFDPIIDEMAVRLREEVKFRAEQIGESPEEALERFEKNIDQLHRHLTDRRKFILDQPEIRAIGN